MATYFGTNGIRGPIEILTPALAHKAAYAIGIFFKSGTILLATDARITGPILKKEVVAGLLAAGCEVVDLGMVSTPTAEFMVRKLRPAGLIIITASHNPPQDNGLKVMDGNEVSLSKERAVAIEEMIDHPPAIAPKKEGSLRMYPHAVEDHVLAMLKVLNPAKTSGKRLLLDYGNGMAATIAPILFKRLGCQIISINSHIDGTFPGRPSEPSKANVKALIEAMKQGGYDAGIAWDGDGDRVIFIDEHGEFVIGDVVFGIAALLKLRQKKGPIITTVATSKLLEDIAASHGASVVYTKIGAPYLCEEMAKGKGILGGEEVGGVMWPEVSLAKDGFLTAAKIVEALSEKPLSKWVEEIPKYYSIKSKIPATAQEKATLLEKIVPPRGTKRTTVDGLRFDFPDGSWVIIRPSGTENYLRIFAESRSQEKAEALAEEFTQKVEKLKRK